MKKIKNIALIGMVAVGVLCSSCSEDFLKPDPLSVVATLDRHLRNYWTYYQAANLVTPFYTLFMHTDLAVAGKTDQSTIWADPSERLTPSDGMGGGGSEVNQFSYFWGETYTGIKSANTITSYIGKIKDMDEASRNKYIGWAYFHRAYRYLSLVFMFKDVPLVTKIIEGPKFDYKTTSREAILAKMVEDMEFAVQWVPEQKDMKEIGLVNKGACRMLLSKLYLATGQWEKAIQQLNEVIDNSGYSLMTNTFGTFVTPFNTETWPIQRNVICDLHRPANKLIAEHKAVILGMPNRGIGSSNSFVAFNTMRALGPLWDDKSNLLDPNGVQAVKSFARSDKNYDSKYDYNRSIGRGTGYLHPTYYSQYGMWEVNGVDDEGDLRRSTKSGNWMMMDSVRVNNPSSKYYGQYLQKSWCKDTIRDWFGWPHYKIYLMDQNAEAKESSTQFNGASSSSTTSGIADWYCCVLKQNFIMAILPVLLWM